MLGGKTWDDWIAQYGQSHQNPVNRLCHTLVIPMIAVSILLLPVLLARPSLWPLAAPASVARKPWSSPTTAISSSSATASSGCTSRAVRA